jgi:hypothetical protein
MVYMIANGNADTPPDAVPYALESIAGDALKGILSGRMDKTMVLAYAGCPIARLRLQHGRAAGQCADQRPALGLQPGRDASLVRSRGATDWAAAMPPGLHQPPASDQLGPWVFTLFDRLERVSR